MGDVYTSWDCIRMYITVGTKNLSKSKQVRLRQNLGKFANKVNKVSHKEILHLTAEV